jgi:hypothetical protein
MSFRIVDNNLKTCCIEFLRKNIDRLAEVDVPTPSNFFKK